MTLLAGTTAITGPRGTATAATTRRSVALLPTVLVPLTAYLHGQSATCTGISFLDSTDLAVCLNARIGQHRVFAGRAKWGKTSVDWFFGFKLHLVVNDRGELLTFCLTPSNVDDRRPDPKLLRRVRRLFGTLFADRGYVSQPLAEQLWVERGVYLITRLRKNMRNRLLEMSDKLLLRKRAISEIVGTQMTKTHVLASGRRGDYVADLDLAIGDDHPINEQLDELAFLLKGGVG